MSKIILYRGVSEPNLKDRVGKWWSTNPYYSYRFSNDGKGFFYCIVNEDYIKNNSEDVSIEEDFSNYFFTEDPSGIRKATVKQIEELLSFAIFTKPRVGGILMRQPRDPITVGISIFGS